MIKLLSRQCDLVAVFITVCLTYITVCVCVCVCVECTTAPIQKHSASSGGAAETGWYNADNKNIVQMYGPGVETRPPCY